ncbi:hypothetical protein CANCADRAFT_19205, partial [Tortispora caseinolytica NRRL Y-17796]
TPVPLDENGKPYTLKNDELVLEEDPKGLEKVDENGNLKGGRDYRCRTFTITGRGDRLYMLSTEPARCIGFRDSYLFFQKHKLLYKIILRDEEKFDLIERDIMPHSYKGRTISVVTARSVFREFGAKIIIGGHRVIDDFYESKAIEEGAKPEDLASPEDVLPMNGEPYNKNQYVAWHGASQVYHQNAPMVGGRGDLSIKRRKVILNETNWLFEHAMSASNFNEMLTATRRHVLEEGGVEEAHTGLTFVPANTQPRRFKGELVP